MAIKTKMTITATTRAEPLKTNSLNKLKHKERDMAKIKTIKGHIHVFLFLDLFNFCFIILKMHYA
jgi:hypothetical protein